MGHAMRVQTNTEVKTEVLYKLLDFSKALLKGDYTQRVITDFNDDAITMIANNFNRFADNMQLDPSGSGLDQEGTVITFIEVISSYTSLDFKQKLPVSDKGTIWDAIATGINMLGDELENSTASKQELERERNLLKEAKEEAEEANKAKSLFLANMSHEIRTPLNGILGLAQIMMSEIENPEHKKYLEMIQQSGKNLGQLINDILDLSKIESGKLELENIPFNFSRAIKNDVERFKLLAEEKGLSLTCKLDDSIPADLIGDPVRISQITSNLLSNAIKFTSHGTIDIAFKLLKRRGNHVLVQGSVKDSGIGISKASQKKVFQSFTQADNSVTRKFGGTGLGLSIVKTLVEILGGNISVESPVNPVLKNGSCFTFTIKFQCLPEEVTHADIDNNRLNPAKELERPLDVLIVDDNDLNLLVARKLVEKFGMKVTTANNGADAIELVQKGNFDLIFMDIQMPELDGYETTKRIRLMKYKNPIIALSANAYPQDIKNSLESGMNDHLQKPFTINDLSRIIQKFASTAVL